MGHSAMQFNSQPLLVDDEREDCHRKLPGNPPLTGGGITVALCEQLEASLTDTAGSGSRLLNALLAKALTRAKTYDVNLA